MKMTAAALVAVHVVVEQPADSSRSTLQHCDIQISTMNGVKLARINGVHVDELERSSRLLHVGTGRPHIDPEEWCISIECHGREWQTMPEQRCSMLQSTIQLGFWDAGQFQILHRPPPPAPLPMPLHADICSVADEEEKQQHTRQCEAMDHILFLGPCVMSLILFVIVVIMQKLVRRGWQQPKSDDCFLLSATEETKSQMLPDESIIADPNHPAWEAIFAEIYKS